MKKTELQKKYNISRYNILLVVILTVVNIGTILYNSTYFLFSLTFPRFVLIVLEIMIEEGEIVREQINYPIVGIIMFLPVILFLLCYIFTSKNRYTGFISAIVLFGIDSIFTIITFDIIDILFHVYIFVLLGLGIKYGRKLNNNEFEPDDELKTVPKFDEYGYAIEAEDSPVLRVDTPKGRTLIKAIHKDLNIIVKRRYGLTELIINGKVYDEIKGVIEMTYQLSADVRGVKIIFKFDGLKMFVIANGNQIAKKLRLI